METARIQFILDDLINSLSDLVYCAVLSAGHNLFMHASRLSQADVGYTARLSGAAPTINALIEDVIASNLLSSMEMINIRFRDKEGPRSDMMMIGPIDDQSFLLVYYEKTVLNNGPVLIGHALKEMREILTTTEDP